jgi:small conductance mechanosensitive channel
MRMLIQDTLTSPDSTAGGALVPLLNVFGIDASLLARRGVEALFILLLAWVAVRIARVLTSRFERRFAPEPGIERDEDALRAKTLAQLLNSVITVAVVVAALLTILNLFIPIGPLLAGVGVLGLAFSFGAQSLVKDVISGFFMLLENQFVVGDIVELGGKGGVVERMSLRMVALRDVEGVLHMIPNGAINSVSNRTRGWARAIVDVGVAYKENVDEVMRVARSVLEEFYGDPEWRPRLTAEPAVWGVQALAESSVDIRVIADTKPGKQWEVKRELHRRLKNRFDAEGIEIPFPQRTLHVRGTNTLPTIEQHR